MDMSKFNKEDYTEARLRRHLFALRNNSVSVALIKLLLHGYDVDMEYLEQRYIGKPNASAAREVLEELEDDRTAIYSCSTKDGGVWETWEREALHTGELGKAWDTWKNRKGL